MEVERAIDFEIQRMRRGALLEELFRCEEWHGKIVPA
jgi:hypothetical protein